MEIPPGVTDIISRALEEDIGPGDITTSLLIPEEQTSQARYFAKENFVLAGLPFAKEVFRLLNPSVEWNLHFTDGDDIRKGRIVAEISGNTCSILQGERVSLNILQRLSGIATLTRKYAEKVKDLNVVLLDTRKTTPCLRFMERYAVRIGGGANHRFGLFDGILIKDNHIRSSGSIREAVKRAKKGHHLTKIEVEVSSLQDLGKAINAGADVVMLDNMTVSDMKQAVKIAKGRVLLEASGGVDKKNLRYIAETGVDFISIGAFTRSAPSVDISLKII